MTEAGRRKAPPKCRADRGCKNKQNKTNKSWVRTVDGPKEGSIADSGLSSCAQHSVCKGNELAEDVASFSLSLSLHCFHFSRGRTRATRGPSTSGGTEWLRGEKKYLRPQESRQHRQEQKRRTNCSADGIFTRLQPKPSSYGRGGECPPRTRSASLPP